MSNQDNYSNELEAYHEQRWTYVQESFLSEGTFVAFPLCFPGASEPIAPDESHITALDVTAAGDVYGGTSGYRAHIFVAMFRRATGMVLDLGVVDGFTSCAAVCCGESKFVAFVNGETGGRVVARKLEPLPCDLLQEWWWSKREPFEDLGEVAKGEKIVHAVCDASRRFAIGCTASHLFSVNLQTGKLELIGEVPGRGKIAVGSRGNIFGFDSGNTLWRFEPAERILTRNAVNLPGAEWNAPQVDWARNPVDGTLLVADTGGRLYSFDESHDAAACFHGPLGQIPQTPVTAMAVTYDGRVFGACGEGIARIFCHDPHRQETRDLETAVSVLQRRRYGYQFAEAITGPNGEIYFGENDNSGHLWIYFPKIGTMVNDRRG
jgi:hypothetical protein